MKKNNNFSVGALFFAVCLAVSGCICSQGTYPAKDKNIDRLQVGWAKRSIAVPGKCAISGQSHIRVALGEYGPVLASALAMSNSRDAVIFVSVDVVSVRSAVYNAAIEIIKKEAPSIPVEKIIVGATHTHAGPATGAVQTSKYPNKVDIVPSEKSQAFIARQIADAVKEAWANRADGSIAYGYGFATVGHSRRTVYLDDVSKRLGHTPGFAINGRCIMYGKTNDDMFDGYEAGTDAFINILYTFDKKGKLSGAVVNVPCPSQTMEAAWMYYASFWHNVREKLADKYGEVGLICQTGAAGDLAPRQLHYTDAEYRRYQLKYSELIEAYKKNPMKNPSGKVPEGIHMKGEVLEMMRSEDIANRIMAAFDEVLSWAKKDMQYAPELKHEVRTLELSRSVITEEIVQREKEYNKKFMAESFKNDGDKWAMLHHNSILNSRRNKVNNILKRYNEEKKNPKLKTEVHVVRIGDVAFATNRFELFLDFMHRIQGRSPFMQTFIVQLVSDQYGVGSYLATERGEANRGYSATPYSCYVSAKGGQELVNETVKMLKDIKAAKK